MSKKIALVTGGNRGIGLESCKQLGSEGFTVLVGVRTKANGEKAVEELKAAGVDAHVLELDMTNEGSIAAAVRTIGDRFGHLDVLVNNAGVSLDKEWKATSIPTKVVRETFETNLFGVIALTQALLPLLQKSAAPRIVNLSSILGSLTLHSDPKSPIFNFKALAYNASKTALNAFTIHLAYELRETPIKVNSAHPGWVKTDMGGPSAPMEIGDGAKTTLWLATLPADGPTGGFFHMKERLPW